MIEIATIRIFTNSVDLHRAINNLANMDVSDLEEILANLIKNQANLALERSFENDNENENENPDMLTEEDKNRYWSENRADFVKSMSGYNADEEAILTAVALYVTIQKNKPEDADMNENEDGLAEYIGCSAGIFSVAMRKIKNAILNFKDKHQAIVFIVITLLAAAALLCATIGYMYIAHLIYWIAVKHIESTALITIIAFLSAYWGAVPYGIFKLVKSLVCNKLGCEKSANEDIVMTCEKLEPEDAEKDNGEKETEKSKSDRETEKDKPDSENENPQKNNNKKIKT